jgi:hypothetical protein
MRPARFEKYPTIDPKKLSPEDIGSICEKFDKMRDFDLPNIPEQLDKSPRTDLDLSIVRALGIPMPKQFVSAMHTTVRKELAALT